MSYSFPPEIISLIDENMATGGYASVNQVLEAALHVLSDYHATVADVRQGIAEYELGKARPLNEVMANVRRQMGSRS